MKYEIKVHIANPDEDPIILENQGTIQETSRIGRQIISEGITRTNGVEVDAVIYPAHRIARIDISLIGD